MEKYFVTCRKGKGSWAVKKSGSNRSIKNFDKKADAVKYGRKTAKKNKPSVLNVQGMDGKFQNRFQYGKYNVSPGR